MKNIITLACVCSLIQSVLYAQERLSMNKGWSFKYIAPNSKELAAVLNTYFYKEAQSATVGWKADPLMQLSFNDSAWRKINIPHDFVIENAPSPAANDTNYGKPIDNRGFLETGIGMYRKLFSLAGSDNGKRIWIRFNGVFRDAQVYLNGFKLTDHKSGYTPFRVDISDVVHYGNMKNVLLVVCDARQPEGWWYEGGGIYRPVYLEKSGGSLYFEPDEIAVNPKLSDDFSSADVEVFYTIQNRERKNRKYKIVARISDLDGNEIASSTTAFDINAWEKMDCRISLNVNSPKLWSPDKSNLYFVESDILENGSVVDKNKTRFGFRSVVFDAEKGLFVNGKHVKVMGASTHQDNGSVGVAVPDEIIRYRIQTMKKFGFNGYRSAHHAAAPSLLDICDEEGMLVLNEQRVTETGSKYLDEMREMIKSSRNHPSVFMYSLGNEENKIVATDFEGGLVSTLMQEITRLDPQHRAATMNRIFWKPGEKSDEVPVEEALKRAYSGAGRILDVSGFSYGDNTMYAYEGKGQPVFQTESSGNMCTIGIYETNKEKLWVSSIPDWKSHERLKKFMATDRITGSFVWTSFDYRGEPTPYLIFPGVSSHFGLFDLCGFPKDPAYFYKAVQSTEPVLHLFPHWNWTGREGENIKLFTYTNLDEVELFLNGKSLGKQKVVPFENQSWDVKYKPGTLLAKGYKAGKHVLTDKVTTAGKPYSVRITAYKNTLKANGEDAVTLKFEILDIKSVVCPNADNIVHITLEGNGHLLGVDNGNPANVNPTKLPTVRAFNGLCSAIIQADENPGNICITATSEDLHSGNLEIKTVQAEIQPAIIQDVYVRDYMFFRKPVGWKFK